MGLNPLRLAVFTGVTLAVVASARVPLQSPMARAAEEFLAALTDEQRGHAVLPASSPDRTTWTYVPGNRLGVAWRDMTPTQREKAMDLLKASLSDKGLAKTMATRQNELLLRKMENNNLGRDPERYWFVFFGAPNGQTPWVWRYEGHHVSLTFGLDGDTVVSSTPQFYGSNPAEVKIDVPDKGKRILGREQDLGFKLAETLTPDQHKLAVVAEKAPADIVTASSRKAGIEGHLGLPYGKMTKDQQATVREILRVFSEVQTPAEQKRRLDKVAKEGYDHLVFAWMGPVKRGGRHYYRVQGESFVIEYDNTQDDGNHIHTVWRDFKGDFGGDALAKHYEQGHHHEHKD